MHVLPNPCWCPLLAPSCAPSSRLAQHSTAGTPSQSTQGTCLQSSAKISRVRSPASRGRERRPRCSTHTQEPATSGRCPSLCAHGLLGWPVGSNAHHQHPKRPPSARRPQAGGAVGTLSNVTPVTKYCPTARSRASLSCSSVQRGIWDFDQFVSEVLTRVWRCVWPHPALHCHDASPSPPAPPPPVPFSPSTTPPPSQHTAVALRARLRTLTSSADRPVSLSPPTRRTGPSGPSGRAGAAPGVRAVLRPREEEGFQPAGHAHLRNDVVIVIVSH